MKNLSKKTKQIMFTAIILIVAASLSFLAYTNINHAEKPKNSANITKTVHGS